MNQKQEMQLFATLNNVPIMMEEGLDFLLKTIKDRQCKKILELGTAIGYSAIAMAMIDEDINIDTIELNKERYDQAVLNIKEANLCEQISCILMNIDDFQTEKKYDLIFVDAAKSQYQKYMDKFKDNLSENGVFFFDNLNFHGIVDDPSLTRSRNTKQLCRKIKKFRENLLDDPYYNVEFYSHIGDGIAIASIKK